MTQEGSVNGAWQLFRIGEKRKCGRSTGRYRPVGAKWSPLLITQPQLTSVTNGLVVTLLKHGHCKAETMSISSPPAVSASAGSGRLRVQQEEPCFFCVCIGNTGIKVTAKHKGQGHYDAGSWCSEEAKSRGRRGQWLKFQGRRKTVLVQISPAVDPLRRKAIGNREITLDITSIFCGK